MVVLKCIDHIKFGILFKSKFGLVCSRVKYG